MLVKGAQECACRLVVIASPTLLPATMMTSSNGNIFRVTGHLCGEFTGLRHRPVTRSFDIFFDLRLNKRLSKQPWGWWFETLSCPLWRQCNDYHHSSHCKSAVTKVRRNYQKSNDYTLNHTLQSILQGLFECVPAFVIENLINHHSRGSPDKPQ